jgi:hypothetical protein
MFLTKPPVTRCHIEYGSPSYLQSWNVKKTELLNKDGRTIHDFLSSCKLYTGNYGGVRTNVTLKLGWLTKRVYDTVYCDGPEYAEEVEIDEAEEQEAGYSDSFEDE